MFESCRAHFAALGRPPSRGKRPAIAESSEMAEAPDGLKLRRHRDVRASGFRDSGPDSTASP
jgi:hypothetical protein